MALIELSKLVEETDRLARRIGQYIEEREPEPQIARFLRGAQTQITAAKCDLRDVLRGIKGA